MVEMYSKCRTTKNYNSNNGNSNNGNEDLVRLAVRIIITVMILVIFSNKMIKMYAVI